MKTLIFTIASLYLSLTALTARAADVQAVNVKAANVKAANEIADEANVAVETTRIKANKEQPNVLYVVPWKEMENSNSTQQKLVLHDFFGNLYDPVLPAYSETKATEPSAKTN